MTNPYLEKLRARDQEKCHPAASSKPSKPMLEVEDSGETTTVTYFEGFEGDRCNRFFWDDLVAGHSTFGRFGHVFEILRSRCPDWVPVDRWQQCVEDGKRFFAQWGGHAEVFDWTARDLFGLAPVPENPRPSYRRLSRYDETGLIWLLEGCEVLALTANTATIRRPSGSTTTYRKNNTPAFGGPSDSLDDLQ
jgi:hypothetical protein